MFSDIACVILAGGRGSRLGGVEKGMVNVHGRPLLQYVLDRVRGQFTTIVLATGRSRAYEGLGLACVPDVLSEPCSLTGLHGALSAVREPWVFAVACDMPAVSIELARELAERRAGRDAVLPISAWGEEPLHALYARACAPVIERFAARGLWKMTAFLAEVRVERVPVAPERGSWRGLPPFFNVNTPEDLGRFENLVAPP